MKQILLGFLSYGPKTGYSLHKSIFKPIRPSLPQIYQALNNMIDQGLITQERLTQEKFPAKNVCHITQKGLTEFRDVLKSPLDSRSPIEPLLPRLWLGTRGNRKDILDLLNRFHDKKKQESEYFKKKANKMSQFNPKGTNSMDNLCWKLCLDLIIQKCELELRWTHKAIKQIATFAPEDPIPRVSYNRRKSRMIRQSK